MFINKISIYIGLTLIFSPATHCFSQDWLGGPVSFDSSRALAGKIKGELWVDKQKIWAKAGVKGGIKSLPRKKTVTTKSDLHTVIKDLGDEGGGTVYFKNGVYRIKKTLFIPANVILEGESLNNTIIKDALLTNDDASNNGTVVEFVGLDERSGHKIGGIKRMKFVGSEWKKNGRATPDGRSYTDMRPKANNQMIVFRKCTNLFLDNIIVLESGGTLFHCTGRSAHHTIRNCVFNGAWNKAGGNGYVNISAGNCLVVNSIVRNVRHFAIQRENAEYNVIYKNIINIDVNFHNLDAGNNLIERNTITLDREQAILRHSIMGPWSLTHAISMDDNYCYANTIREPLPKRCEKRAFVYIGASGYENFDENPFEEKKRIGKDKSLYSVKR